MSRKKSQDAISPASHPSNATQHRFTPEQCCPLLSGCNQTFTCTSSSTGPMVLLRSLGFGTSRGEPRNSALVLSKFIVTQTTLVHTSLLGRSMRWAVVQSAAGDNINTSADTLGDGVSYSIYLHRSGQRSALRACHPSDLFSCYY
jgi:hypothetical protein